MTIYLIRHGKTEANERSLYCGSTDLHLSEAGVDGLKQLHYDIQGVRFITSGMHRSNEILQVLFGNVPFTEEPRFQEVNYGIFEMTSGKQLGDDLAYRAWLAGDWENNVPPRGESISQMKKRAIEAFSEIRENTLVVTHGGVISGIMQALFPEENRGFYQWEPRNGCGYAITGHSYHSIP